MRDLVEVIETGVEVVGTERVFQSKQLQAQTKAIEKLMNATKRNLYEISARLLVIKNDELYTADGYKDVFEYASQVLGYKKQMVYKMIQVAQALVIETGKKEYHSIFFKSGDSEDYTVSQLMEMTTLESEQLEELNECKVISPDMTTKEIRTAIKEYKDELKGVDDIEEDTTGEVASLDSDSNLDTNDDNEVARQFDIAVQAIITEINEILAIVELDKESQAKLTEDLDFYQKLSLKTLSFERI